MPHRIASTSASNAAPDDLPPLVVSPGSAHHDSLPSFLAYARRNNLTPDKTTYIGTHYEYTAALALQRLGFSLLRIGRARDAGIDLIGHWVLAPLREPLPVILQCKAYKTHLLPAHVRELEGSFSSAPAEWKNKHILGLLVTTCKASKGILDALGQSRSPVGFILVSREGLIEQFVWNRVASECGLEGVGVTVRHTPRALLNPAALASPTKKPRKRDLKFRNTGTQRDIVLTWMGSPIFPARRDLDLETQRLMQHIVTDDAKHGAPSTGSDLRYCLENTNCRYKVTALAPEPRGGKVGNKRGRPRKRVLFEGDEEPPNQSGDAVTVGETTKKKRGRPKGSKNRVKVAVDAG